MNTLYTKLHMPFGMIVSEETYRSIKDIASTTQSIVKGSVVHKVIGIVHARMTTERIKIACSSAEHSKLAEVRIIHSESGKIARICMLDIEMSVAVGLKSIAQSIKKGGIVPWSAIEEIAKSTAYTSYIDKLAVVSVCKAAVKAGIDRDSVCYNRIVSMVGDSNSTVKIKAMHSAVYIGDTQKLQEQTAEALQREGDKSTVNTVWAPGMLGLLGMCIYKDRREYSAYTEMYTQAVQIAQRYICKTEDERVLHGVLVVLWAMTERGTDVHISVLVVLALLCRHASVQKSAKGLIVAHIGSKPDKRSLHMMDAVCAQRADVQRVLHMYKVHTKGREMLVAYANMLVAEGTAERIRTGVYIRRLAKEKGWVCDTRSIFSIIAGMRIALHEDNTEEMYKIVQKINSKDVCAHVPITKEMARIALIAIRRIGIEQKSAQDIVMTALTKNICIYEALRVLEKHMTDTIEKTLLRTHKTPGVVLALSHCSNNITDTQYSTMQKESDAVYIASVYMRECRKDKEERKRSMQATTSMLLSKLECYDTDSSLGDVGAHTRMDALLLLCMQDADRRKMAQMIPERMYNSGRHHALVPLRISTRYIKLTKEQKQKLHACIVKMAIDKSRMISTVLLQCILPCMHTKTKVLAWIQKGYEEYACKYGIEDACVMGTRDVMQKIARTVKRKKRQNSSAESIEYYSAMLTAMIEGVVNTLLSADGCLFSKVLAEYKVVLQDREVCKVLAHTLSIQQYSTILQTVHRIQEIREKLEMTI